MMTVALKFLVSSSTVVTVSQYSLAFSRVCSHKSHSWSNTQQLQEASISTTTSTSSSKTNRKSNLAIIPNFLRRERVKVLNNKITTSLVIRKTCTRRRITSYWLRHSHTIRTLGRDKNTLSSQIFCRIVQTWQSSWYSWTDRESQIRMLRLTRVHTHISRSQLPQSILIYCWMPTTNLTFLRLRREMKMNHSIWRQRNTKKMMTGTMMMSS